MTTPTIGFAGMTHLGLNSAAAAAQKGFRCVCFDSDAARIESLKDGRTDITESGLSELLTANVKQLAFTSAAQDLSACDLVYIALDVPTDAKGVSNLTPVRAMIEKVNEVIAPETLLIVLCQVPPGFTRSLPRDPARLYYQVETLIFGRAVERALYPERYIIGCADPTQPLPPVYRHYLEAYECPILPMRYESAELAKTAINLFLAASVSTSNTLAELCEVIGADWQEIVPSLQLDKRIGPHAYLQPGLGLSGGNIERDLETLSQLGYERGAKTNVTRAYIDHSYYRKQWPIRAFFAHYNNARPDFTVSILGLTYKADTHSMKNSPALELIAALPQIHLRLYDPVIKKLLTDIKGECCATAYAAAASADILFVMTPWEEFKKLDWTAIKKSMRGHVVIDPYGIVPPKQTTENFIQLVLGKAVS